MKKVQPWELSDALWNHFRPLIPRVKPSPFGGRPRINDKTALSAIFYLLSTGGQWKSLPKSFGLSPSTAHSRFKTWADDDVFFHAWKNALKTYDKAKKIRWAWQSVDGAMTKAPLGGEKTGSNPTDRSKMGTKRSLLTDQHGIPLSVVVDGANRHDMKMLKDTLDEIVIRRPSGELTRQHLCLDKGYDYPDIHRTIGKRKFINHIKRRGEEIAEKKKNPRFKARRWVVERTHSWINRFRRLLVRWEKKISHYLSFLYLACACIVVRSI
jgi:putative transposase